MKKKKHPPLYARIREILESARSSAARSVNTTQVIANWLIGREIVEEELGGRTRAAYGAKLMKELSRRLSDDYGGGFSLSGLKEMRAFYIAYPNLLGSDAPLEKSRAVRGFLPGSGVSMQKSHAVRGQLDIAQILDGTPRKSWSPGFLHPTLSWTHYRTLLRVEKPQSRAFYEIEAAKNTLKVGKLTHQDLGQFQLYVNYYDHERLSSGDNPTLGLILCTDKNDAVVKYTLGNDTQKKIFASRYKLYLPTAAELTKEIRRKLRLLGSAHNKA